ncbi:MAG: DUF368 domain-containing protein [Deinococcales bacterium]|nr:DUF368 domain-containing protein [Deinococcales bacterium]
MNLKPAFQRYVTLFFKGFAVGGANIVPAISGGTMALILGIYPRLIGSLVSLTRPDFLRLLIRLRIRKAQQSIDTIFLLTLGLGIITAVLTLSRGLEWLLTNHHTPLFSFFFGLVLGSVVSMLRSATKWYWTQYTCFASAALGAFFLFSLAPANTPTTPWFLFLCGGLSICALILPGISGAYVLVLLGKYNHLLVAINSGDLSVLGPVAAGSLIGLLSFVRLLSWLLKHYQHTTHAVLTGLVMGSLRKLWPWNLTGNKLLDTTPTAPQLEQISVALILALIGFLTVLVLDHLSAKQ